jgi:putative transposase
MLIGAFIAEADLLRKAHPGCGVAKIYDTLKPNWIGRVNGVKLLYSYGFKLQKKINYKRTTFSVSSPYHNLIEGMLVTNKNQVWQSDITFIWVDERFYYLVFIIDIYTKQIVGYSVSDNMRTACNLKALQQAFRSQKGRDLSGLVHHSDKGSQYGDHRYRKQLEDRGIWISMGMMAQANAYAERLNGIIKNEFLNKWSIKNFAQLKQKVKKAVDYYNNKRIHRHLPRKLTPNQFDAQLLYLDTQNRPKVIVHTEGNPKLKATFRSLEFYPETEPHALVCPMVY